MTIDQSNVNIFEHVPNLRELKAGSGEWHGACPIDGCSADDDGFMTWPATQNYYCRTCGNAGDWIQLIQLSRPGVEFAEALTILGLEDNYRSNGRTKDKPRIHVSNSKVAYQSRAHYAAAQGIPEQVLIDAGFSEIKTYQKRPILEYPTYDSAGYIHLRVRFMDGLDPKYKPVGLDAPSVWYRLQQAIGIRNKQETSLVIVNGELSVLAAQHRQIPAIAKTGGEMKLNSELLAELVKMNPPDKNPEILIALDCDDKGRKTATDIKAQLKELGYEPVVVDLGFADTGDFANFCKLYTKDASNRLKALVEAQIPVSYNAHSAAKDFTKQIINKVAPAGRIIMMPFEPLRALGGDAKFMQPKRLTLIGSMSGHFKTGFCETMIDDFLPRGLRGIMDGQEFDDKDYHLRRILRWSGRTIKGLNKKDDVFLTPVSHDELTLNKMHLQENRDNVPSFMRQAENPFTGKSAKEKLDTISYIEKLVTSWKGHIEYVPPGHMFIEDKIIFMTNWVQEQRATGKAVDFAIFDYIQIMASRSKDIADNAYQYALFLMKQFAIEMNLHVIVVSQVNKQPSKEAKKNNKRLNVEDFSYINDRYANLTIALNFYYAAQTENGEVVKDFNGDTVIERKVLKPSGYNAAVVDVLKNSHGQPAPVRMPVDAKHLRWINSTWGN